MTIPLKKGEIIKYLAILLVFVFLLPVFIKVADLSRFVIFTTSIKDFVLGILYYYFRERFIFSLLSLIVFVCIFVFLLIKISKRKLYKNILFISGLIVLLIEVLPSVLLLVIKPFLLFYYLSIFCCLFIFLLFRNSPYDFLKNLSVSALILFPLFSLLLLIGFNSSAARPKTTILSNGPSHNWYDEVCDRKRFLSQKEVRPVWLENLWVYSGVATKDGKYFYFADNGYGIIGFRINEKDEYERLPFVKYPPDFKAALYSHRLYLTPDENYLYYYGARSAEFVFIDREKLEVSYVIPTKNGLDGFSAAMDTVRNLIYGFPFIGKKIPVLYYNSVEPILLKWLDFSGLSGWVVQGFYNEKNDSLILHTTDMFAEYSANSLKPLRSINIGPVATRSDYVEDRQLILFSNIFLNKMDILDLNSFTLTSREVPFGIREISYLENMDGILLFDFSGSSIFLMRDGVIKNKIYAGPRPRGIVKLSSEKKGKRIIIGSGCGIFELKPH